MLWSPISVRVEVDPLNSGGLAPYASSGVPIKFKCIIDVCGESWSNFDPPIPVIKASHLVLFVCVCVGGGGGGGGGDCGGLRQLLPLFL